MIAPVEQHLEDIRALCREYDVTRLELFGSGTRGDFDPTRSDIDFLVEFAPGTNLGPWMARFFELQDRLASLLGHRVDLIMTKGIRNPYLIQSIAKDRHVLYAA